MIHLSYMKTKTINLRDLPEELVRRAKACAALHGMTLKDFVVQAIAKATEKDLPAMPTGTGLVGSYRRAKRRSRQAKRIGRTGH